MLVAKHDLFKVVSMESKYIFLDVEGTLVNYSNELPDSAVKAIKVAQANG